MPRLQGIELNQNVAGPSNRGLSVDRSGEIEAQGLQAVGQGVKSAGDQLFQRAKQAQILDVAAGVAEKQAGLEREWEEMVKAADPADKNLARDFLKIVDDQLSELNERASVSEAKNYLAQSTAQMRSHFERAAFAGQSELAGVKAKQDYITVQNQFSAALVNDPSSFEMNLQMHDQALEALVQSGGLPREAALQLQTQGKTELAKSAIRGWINLDPESTKEDLKAGKWDQYVDGDLKKQMNGEADLAINARRIEAERLQRLQEDRRKEAQRERQNQYLDKMIDGDLSTEDIRRDTLLDFDDRKQLLDMMRLRNKEGIQTDSSTFVSLFNRINLPDGSPEKIVDERELNQYLGRGLDLNDLVKLRKEIQGATTAEGKQRQIFFKQILTSAKNQLSKSNDVLNVRDPEGDAQYARFLSIFQQTYQEKKSRGVSDAQMADPKNKEYIGNLLQNFYAPPGIDLILEQSTRMRQEIVQPNADGTVPPPPPLLPRRNPGESLKEFRKRIGAGP